MAVHAIEWQISQHLLGPDKTDWDQVMEHFLKVYMIFMLIFMTFYFHGMFWPLYLDRRVNPHASF